MKISQTQIEKKRLTRSKLPPKVKKLVTNRKYFGPNIICDSQYDVESHIGTIAKSENQY